MCVQCVSTADLFLHPPTPTPLLTSARIESFDICECGRDTAEMKFGKRGDDVQVFVFPFRLEGFFSVSDMQAHARSASLFKL